MRSEKDKMLTGELYDASDAQLQADAAAAAAWMARYNATLAMPAAERHALLVERFAAAGPAWPLESKRGCRPALKKTCSGPAKCR